MTDAYLTAAEACGVTRTVARAVVLSYIGALDAGAVPVAEGLLHRERPTRDEMFMDFAHAAARRSKCGRLVRVGAVVATWDGTSVVSMGYNGAAKGLQEDCDPSALGVCGCVHAEANALLKAPYGQPLRMYVTLSPCATCARLLINSSVKEVVYAEEYRDPSGLELLTRAGLSHRRLS